MVCSLHSVTTGSRDRANVPLIIIIIITISFVQIVRTRLPSQAIDLAVHVGGEDNNV